MKTPAFILIALAMSASAFSQTSAPAAPSLTAGAEFKGLRFDWDAVPGASWYQIEYRAHQTGAFVQQGDDFPAAATSTRFTFPLHLFDWTYARYRVAACNSAGCTRSAEVSVSDLRRDAVGYFKSPTPLPRGNLGEEIDLSADGYTLVATAPGETTTTANGGSAGGGVYVFRRGSNGQWLQRSRIAAHTSYAGGGSSSVGLDVAVSASGNTVAVALTSEVADAAKPTYGQVDVYSWKNNVYSAKRIPRPEIDKIDGVQLSDSGYVLAVIGSVSGQPIAAIYKSTNGVWQIIRIISAADYCPNLTLTRDGKTLAATCYERGDAGSERDYVRLLSGSTFATRTEIEIDRPTGLEDERYSHGHQALGLDATGDTVAVQVGDEYYGSYNTAQVYVYHRDGGVYQKVATFTPGEWNMEDDLSYNLQFGQMISVSGDGHTIALGHKGDRGKGLGPRAAPLLASPNATGAVFVYRLTDSWKLANMVKPNYVSSSNAYTAEFPGRVALSGTGKTLVVGMAGDDSSARGIDGNWANASLADSGALFMY